MLREQLFHAMPREVRPPAFFPPRPRACRAIHAMNTASTRIMRETIGAPRTRHHRRATSVVAVGPGHARDVGRPGGGEGWQGAGKHSVTVFARTTRLFYRYYDMMF